MNQLTAFDYGALPSDQVSFLEDCARGVEAGVKITVEGIMEIGKCLVAARDSFGGNDKAFGQWRQGRLPWLTINNASRFIQVYEKFSSSDLLHQNDGVEKLSPSILYFLAAPSTPDSVVTDITARIQSGERVKVKDVQAAIKEAKSNVVAFPSPASESIPLPLPSPGPRIEGDSAALFRAAGFSPEWMEKHFSAYTRLQEFYSAHVRDCDPSVLAEEFVRSMPADLDCTCLFALAEFLVKVVALKGSYHAPF